MQIGDNESSTAKDFPVVSVEIREVALVQIRYCKIKGLTVQETQLLHVGDTILITPGLHSFGGFNHETAEIDTQNISGSPSRKKSTKSSFAASAIQNPLIRKFCPVPTATLRILLLPGPGLPRVIDSLRRALICQDSALTKHQRFLFCRASFATTIIPVLRMAHSRTPVIP